MSTTDQIPMRSATERREAAKRVISWLRVQADRAREVINEISDSRGASSMEDVFAARDAADDALEHYVAHIEKQATILDALLEVPEVGISEKDVVDEAIRATPMHVSDEGLRITYDDLVTMLTNTVRNAERAALEHWEPADVPSQEFMLRHLELDARPARNGDNEYLFIPAQYLKKEII